MEYPHCVDAYHKPAGAYPFLLYRFCIAQQSGFVAKQPRNRRLLQQRINHGAHYYFYAIVSRLAGLHV